MSEIILEPFSELRFEVSGSKELKIFIVEGNCEIIGQELLNERWYSFKNIKSFFYTIKGCKLKLEGSSDLHYKSSESNIKDIINLFLRLNNNLKNILVLGKSRSTFVTILLNLFSRIRQKVVFTELEPNTGNIVFPGVIGSSVVDKIIDFFKGFEMPNTKAYFYGSTRIADKDHYFRLVDEISAKELEYPNIILGPNDIELAEEICKKFQVNEIIFVGDERLLHMLSVDVKKTWIKQSSGLIEENPMRKVREYFYGKNNNLTPFCLCLKDQKIFEKEHQMLAPESALPLGSTRRIQEISIKEVEFANNFVMGILDCEEETQMPHSPVIGFVLALEKEDRRILAPQPKMPKNKFLLRGEIKYFES